MSSTFTDVELKSFEDRLAKYATEMKDADGDPIRRFIQKSDCFIVYESGSGNLAWEHIRVPTCAITGLARYEELASFLNVYKGRIHRKQLIGKLAVGLIKLFRSSDCDEATAQHCFNDVQQYIDEINARKIMYQAQNYYIYLSNEGGLTIQYESTNSPDATGIPELTGYCNWIDHSLENNQKLTAYRMLCEAVPRFLNSGNVEEFKKVEDYIIRTERENVSLKYTQLSVNWCIALSLVLWVLYLANFTILGIPSHVYLGAFGGAIGTFISILQRSKNLNILPFPNERKVVYEGAIRALLGAAFGAILIAFIYSEFVVSIAPSSLNEYQVIILGMIAGISERFVPNLLEKKAKQLDK